MSFNGSGTFVLNSGGLPYVTGTTISSTHANNLNTDLASGLSTCITKDGQTTVTANLPMATFRHTNVGAASARTDYARASQVQDSTLILVGSVAGTNTLTGSLTPAITAYAAGQFYTFIPANTNTGATTININSVGARNIFWNGAACVGGELMQNVPAVLYDDGTRFHIVGNGFNAPFLDTHAIVEGSADSTKKVRIEVDGLTTATTRVITMPDANVNLGDLANVGLVKLNSGSVTNQATLDIVMTSYTGYRHKKVVLHLLPATDAVSLDLRVSTDGGSNYDAGASDYGIEVIVGGATTTANTTGITLSSGGLIGNASPEGFSADINLYDTNQSALWTRVTFSGAQVDSTAGQVVRFPHGSGARRAAQDTDAIRFLFSSGNIASGVWTLYGFN